MEWLQRAAIVADLAQRLRDHHSWCGQTHLQKAAFILQALTDVDLGYEFVPYKFGPFSSGFSNEIYNFRATGIFEHELVPPYGARLKTTEVAKAVREAYSRTLKAHERKLEFVAGKLGGKGVGDLEKLATSVYLLTNFPDEAEDRIAERLHEMKPHISPDDARQAVNEAVALREGAKAISGSS